MIHLYLLPIINKTQRIDEKVVYLLCKQAFRASMFLLFLVEQKVKIRMRANKLAAAASTRLSEILSVCVQKFARVSS